MSQTEKGAGAIRTQLPLTPSWAPLRAYDERKLGAPQEGTLGYNPDVDLPTVEELRRRRVEEFR
jgi:hypothetical protein